MALNTGGFTLGVMPTAPTGVEKLGAFNVGQVLEASRSGADNVEAAFNTPFRVQREIAKTKATQAESKIAQAKAARAAEVVDAELADVKESVKAQELANRLSSNTLDARTKLTQTQADLSAAELAFTNETNPLKKKELQANLDAARTKADTAKAEYDAALFAGLYAARAAHQADMARWGTKALAGFDENGTREIAPGVIQTFTPTADGATVSTTTTPSAKPLAAKPQTVPVYMGTDDNGNAIIQNYFVDPATGEPRSAVGAKLTVRDLPPGVVGAEGYKAPTKVSKLQKAWDARLVKSLETLPDDLVKYKNAKEQIQKAKDKIREGNSLGTTSGRWAGAIPDFIVRSRADAMNAAQRAIQDQLRAIYGAQFTKEEGERFFKTIFDSYATEEENIDRLNTLQDSLDRAINVKIAMSEWIQAGNDTFQGFHGKLLPAVLTAEEAKNFRAENVEESLRDLTPPAQGEPKPMGVQTAQATVKTGPTKPPRVIQNGVTFVLQPDGRTYLPETPAQGEPKTGPTKAPRVVQNGVTFVLQPDGVTYLPE